MAVTNTPSGEGKVTPLAATGTQHIAPREDKPLVKPESYLNLATDEDRRAFCAARQMAKRAASEAEPPELRRKWILNELLRSQEPAEREMRVRQVWNVQRTCSRIDSSGKGRCASE